MISSRTAAFSFGNSSFSTPYVVGIVLSLGVALFARRVGLDRDRGWIVVGGLAGHGVFDAPHGTLLSRL
jgi:hypothetical protein